MVVAAFTYEDIDYVYRFAQENSPCVRRKYGVLIRRHNYTDIVATNRRVGRCCNETLCARDTMQVKSGLTHERVEVGAEIHAEQAALIHWNINDRKPYQLLIVGSDHLGIMPKVEQHYPCHVCAMMLKYAGFDYIWTPKDKTELQAISISEVIDYHERLY